mgnify:CR=1 FL=1
MVENIKLEDLLKVGGNEWRKENMHRIYFNDLPGLYGLNAVLKRLDGLNVQEQEVQQ